jgi:hypothetical protein
MYVMIFNKIIPQKTKCCHFVKKVITALVLCKENGQFIFQKSGQNRQKYNIGFLRKTPIYFEENWLKSPKVKIITMALKKSANLFCR